MRGAFEIISISDDGQHLVALEIGWRNDTKKLADGLADYADFCKVGVDDMVPDTIYACMDGDIWRRCRMMSRYGPGGFLVELIDRGGSTTVARDKILVLSQLYKDWSVKSMDVSFTGYSIRSGSQDKTKELQEMLSNKSFQLVYTVERTSAQHRDRIFITEIKQENDNVLDALIQKGFLKEQAQQQQQHERPFSQQTNYARPPRQERAPLRPQRPITKSGSGPQRFDRRPRPPYEVGATRPMQQGPEYGGSGHQALQQQISPATENGWGTVDLRNDDTGSEQWAAQQADDVSKDVTADWSDQRENQDPQTSWSNAKQWATTGWRDNADAITESTSVAVQPAATPGRGYYNQQHQRISPKGHQNQETRWSSDAANESRFERDSDVESPSQGGRFAEPVTTPATHHQIPCRREGRPLRGNSTESPQQPLLPHAQKKRTPSVQSANDDVFSSAGDWSEPPMKKESLNTNELPQRVENLHININGADNPADECERCIQLANKVNTLESSLYSATIQKLIGSRLGDISAELRQVKVHLAQLRLDPAAQENDIVRYGLTHYRREGRVRVKEAEELLQTASSETLASFGMNGWSQFVGVIWKPMMDLQYLDERPLCVYKGTVIRRVVLEDHVQSEVVDLSQQQPSPPKPSPERATVLLERAIEIPRMFPVLQDLAPDRAQGRVHSVFFSEDNSKVFIQLECPQSAEEDLEEFAKSTIAILNELHIIDQ